MSALSDALHEANVDQLSMREIARRGGDRVHHSALGKYFKPTHGRPSEEVLEVFSEVLHIPLSKLRQLAGLPAGEGQPYEPPREANRLDRRQRRLVDELIRMLAETKVGDGDVDRDAAPMTVVHSAGSGKSYALMRAFEDARQRGMQVEFMWAPFVAALNDAGLELDQTQVEAAFQLMVQQLEQSPDLVEDLAARKSTD